MLTQLPLLQEAAHTQLVDRIMPGDLVPIIIVSLAVVAGMIIALVSIVMTTWRRVRERQVAASLMQDMLDRNMTPQEIQQLIGVWSQASGAVAEVSRKCASREVPHLPPKPVKPMA